MATQLCMTIYLPELDSESTLFPPVETALTEPNGLLAMGGDLKPARLVQAYQSGIFPWYSIGEPILWWSPSPRAILNPAEFKPSRSLKKYFRKSDYRVSINRATEEVIKQCRDVRSIEETWIDSRMQKAYSELAKLGRCHSVEVWSNEQLVGGLYGIQVGKLFCGESMFSTKTNASKVALWLFCHHFSRHGGELIDCQILNPHTESLGAKEIDRLDYLQKLAYCKESSVEAGCFEPQWLNLPPTPTETV